MQLLERYFSCLVSQYQKWELLCWPPTTRWQHLEAWRLVCKWGKVGSSPKSPRKPTAWELALRVTRSGVCYLQSWSWFPQSPPSGCPPLRYSQASGQWLGQCSHSARGKWGQGIKKSFPVSQCVFPHGSPILNGRWVSHWSHPLPYTKHYFIRDAPCTKPTKPVPTHTAETWLLHMEPKRLFSILSHQRNTQAFLFIFILLGGNGFVVFKCGILITSLSLDDSQYRYYPLAWILQNIPFTPINESKTATLVHNENCKKIPASRFIPSLIP